MQQAAEKVFIKSDLDPRVSHIPAVSHLFFVNPAPTEMSFLMVCLVPQDVFIAASARGSDGGFKGTEFLFRLPFSAAHGNTPCLLDAKQWADRIYVEKMKKQYLCSFQKTE